MMATKFKVLLVEDDPSLGFIMKDALESSYDVSWFDDGIKAQEAIESQPFDLCLLDIMLPNKSGFELAEIIRVKNKEIPILFVSARAMEEDRIKGFLKGGDDYITKPFSMEELKHRMAVFLKRSQRQAGENGGMKIGSYVYEHSLLKLKRNDHERKLTRKEGDLLYYLSKRKNEILKREEILIALWGKDDYFTGRSLDVFISKLRKYFAEDQNIAIENYHGVGFLLKIVG